MTYEETLSWLYQQLPMYSRIGPAAYKKDLHNIRALCEVIGDPHKKIKTIHVAGTNGKGSTSHMLAAVLQKAGYKTGLYTSPHVRSFGERIRINGEMIDPQFVIGFVEKIKQACGEIDPSFFEVTVAMAFEYFAEQKIDIAVIETGLGGKLDSTNIITPVLSVITNIGMDHSDILGNTIPDIANQKAGIIKQNVPVVIGEVIKDTKFVFEQSAEENEAPLVFAEEKFIIEYIEPFGSLLLCNIKNTDTNIVEKFRLDLTGLYQTKNARTVLCCIDELRKQGFEIPAAALHEGLGNVKKITGLLGRWDTLYTNPSVIVDAAHNKDGIFQVIDQLNNTYPSSGYHFILGFVKDKDISGMLELLPKSAKFYFTNGHIPRALPHHELKDVAAKAGLTGESYDDVNEAISVARQTADPTDIIVVCGSFFIIGEIKNL
jgi:dihydrofolate synthase/folylpolyglutamate synthase